MYLNNTNFWNNRFRTYLERTYETYKCVMFVWCNNIFTSIFKNINQHLKKIFVTSVMMFKHKNTWCITMPWTWINFWISNDLHHGQIIDENNYRKKMSMLATSSGLWCDSIAIIRYPIFATVNLCLELKKWLNNDESWWWI